MSPSEDQTVVDDVPAAISSQAGGLIGRRAQLEWLDDIAQKPGLVQVVGAPGVGKSRLVEAWLDRVNDGDVYTGGPVRCDGRPGSREIVGAVLAAAGEEEPYADGGEADAPALAGLLERSPARILVLDLAHGMEGGPRFLEGLVEHAPQMTVVVATQQRQRVMCATEIVRLEGLATDAAVELLRRRAAVTSGPVSEFGERSQFEALVEAVGGLPLALEAAADLSHLMTARDILDHWREDPTWLFGDAERGPRRQLEARMAAAWDALSDDERQTLARLSVMSAPFSVDLLESVQPEGAEPTASIELLERLVNKSWLRRRTRSGRAEFLLEPVFRRFAGRRLADRERKGVVDRVSEYAAGQMGQLVDRLESGPSDRACERLRARETMFLEVGAAVAESSPRRALELFVGLGRFQAVLADTQKLRRQLDALLEETESGAVDTGLRIRGMARLVELAQEAGEPEMASRWARNAVEAAAGLEDEAVTAEALLASSFPLTGVDLEAAIERLEEARDHADAARPIVEARIAIRLGYVALRQFELERARERFERARERLAEVADPALRSELAAGLGYVAFRMNRPQTALASFEEVVEQEQTIGTTHRIADACFNLGAVALELGELSRAQRELERAHDLWSEEDRMQMAALALIRIGTLFAERGEFERARSVLRRALRIGDRFADAHNRAVAEGTLALVAMLEAEASPPVDVFRDTLDRLVEWRDPAVTAVFRTAVDVRQVLAPAAGGEADRGHPGVSLGGLLSLIGPQDHRLRQIVTALAQLRVEAFERMAPERIDPDWREIVSSDGPGAEAGEVASAWGRLLAQVVDREVGASESGHAYGPPPEEADYRLRVHANGHWFQVDDGERVDLMTRRPLRRILGAIVQGTVDSATAGVSVDELIEVGWPDQSPTRESGANRVYNVIRMLRDKGLDDIIVTGESGYVVDASVAVELEASDSPA